MKREEAFAALAQQVIALMETEGMGWTKPWASRGTARNPFTGAVYRGMNSLILGLTMAQRDWDSPLFATRKQIFAAGGQITADRDDDVQCWFYTRRTVGEGDDERNIGFVKPFWLFNVKAQTTLEVPEPETRDHDMTEVDGWIYSRGVPVHHDGMDRAYYRPATDSIHLPHPEDFATAEGLYATAFHELIHATGHKSRLDRHFGSVFGDHQYAAEELVAEMGAAMLCQQMGVSPEPRADHARYLNSWMQALREKPQALYTASQKAAQAAGWLLDYQQADIMAEAS